MRLTAKLTASILTALSALHLAWAFGSSFPFRSRAELADAIVGTSDVPPPSACLAVAGALAATAALLAEVVPLAPSVRRTAIRGAASVLGFRGALGLMGKTEMLAPGSNSERFVRLDRRIYAPLCLVVSIGCLAS
jgi:Protein of unknown function (DUF3995)